MLYIAYQVPVRKIRTGAFVRSSIGIACITSKPPPGPSCGQRKIKNSPRTYIYIYIAADYVRALTATKLAETAALAPTEPCGTERPSGTLTRQVYLATWSTVRNCFVLVPGKS